MRSDPPRAPDAAAISVRGVARDFGAVRAVDGIDLEIGRGEVFGLIGHNGAGKSTLFKMMLGLLRPTEGEIRIEGTPVHGRDFREVRRAIGYLPENVVLYDNLTGAETLRFFARLKDAPLAECGPTLERVGLAHAQDRAVREYSKGMRQRLGFAQALLGRPRVLFLDEPTTGLDPQATREFYATLRGLQEEGATILLTSHVLAEMQQRVDRLAILAAGRVQATGSVQELRDQAQLPLRLEIQAAEGRSDAVEQALAHLPLTHRQWHGPQLVARCTRAAKMPLLAAVGALGGAVCDLKVLEPTLEEVFFGFAE